MKTICIIPARGGSKRIKNKNIKLFNGKPIIYWSIKAAQESGCFSKIIVSIIYPFFNYNTSISKSKYIKYFNMLFLY